MFRELGASVLPAVCHMLKLCSVCACVCVRARMCVCAHVFAHVCVCVLSSFGRQTHPCTA